MAAHMRAAARAARLLNAIFQQATMRERLQWDGAAAFAITQVEMTRDMNELTVKWRAMDFATEGMRERLSANAASIRKSLAKAAGFKRVPRLKFVLDIPAEEKFIETEKLGIEYILNIWKAQKENGTSQDSSLVKRFDDLIQRRLLDYAREKGYQAANSKVSTGDIGAVIAKTLRVVFKVHDDNFRSANEQDLWEQLQEEVRKDEEVETAFWDLCELVAESNLTGDELNSVFRENDDLDDPTSSLSSRQIGWSHFGPESLSAPAKRDKDTLEGDAWRETKPSTIVEAFEDRAEYAMYRISEILREATDSSNSIEGASEQEEGLAVGDRQIQRINKIVDTLSEKERERLHELMHSDNDDAS